MADPEKLRRDLRRGFLGVLVLLVQFLLGMTLNLFVELPTNHPGARLNSLGRRPQRFRLGRVAVDLCFPG